MPEEVVPARNTKEEKETFLKKNDVKLSEKDEIATMARIREMSIGEKSTPERRERAMKQFENVIAIPGTKFGE